MKACFLLLSHGSSGSVSTSESKSKHSSYNRNVFQESSYFRENFAHFPRKAHTDGPVHAVCLRCYTLYWFIKTVQLTVSQVELFFITSTWSFSRFFRRKISTTFISLNVHFTEPPFWKTAEISASWQ